MIIEETAVHAYTSNTQSTQEDRRRRISGSTKAAWSALVSYRPVCVHSKALSQNKQTKKHRYVCKFVCMCIEQQPMLETFLAVISIVLHKTDVATLKGAVQNKRTNKQTTNKSHHQQQKTPRT